MVNEEKFPVAERGNILVRSTTRPTANRAVEKQMDAYAYCKARQQRWAADKGLSLIGSKGERGEKAYTTTLEANLFCALSEESRREFEQGDGKELVEDGGPAKMQAVHSSAVLTVNVFEDRRHQSDRQPLTCDATGRRKNKSGHLRSRPSDRS